VVVVDAGAEVGTGKALKAASTDRSFTGLQAAMLSAAIVAASTA
jgi:hypothetical protein